MTPAALDIKNYVNDGFVQVCRVVPMQDGSWNYADINTEVMYSEHTSWVYFIVEDGIIVKVGETGNPLGIKSRTFVPGMGTQPITGTKSRFGRYRQGDLTDRYVRESTWNQAIDQRVTLWAKQCPTLLQEVTIQGLIHQTKVSMHKHLELDIMQHMITQGCWPRLNKAMK